MSNITTQAAIARDKKFDSYQGVRFKRRAPRPPVASTIESPIMTDLVQPPADVAVKQSLAMEAVSTSVADQSRTFIEDTFYLAPTFSPEPKKSTFITKALYGFVGSLVTAGAIFGVYSSISTSPNTDVAAAAPQQSNTLGAESSQALIETKPDSDAFFSYQVGLEEPRYLRIPSLSVYSRIKQMSLSSSDIVNVPENIFDTGWHEDSALPGAVEGRSLLVGHESGPTVAGAFALLSSLQTGQTIEIEKGDGDIVQYEIVAVTAVDTAREGNPLAASAPTAGSPHSLQLVSIAATYNQATVVTATPLYL